MLKNKLSINFKLTWKKYCKYWMVLKSWIKSWNCYGGGGVLHWTVNCIVTQIFIKLNWLTEASRGKHFHSWFKCTNLLFIALPSIFKKHIILEQTAHQYVKEIMFLSFTNHDLLFSYSKVSTKLSEDGLEKKWRINM